MKEYRMKPDMKDRLTSSQSQHLIDLGIAPNKASEWKGCGSTSRHGLGGQVMVDYSIFTLADILSILPKRIDNLCLTILSVGFDYETEEFKERWTVSYVDESMICDDESRIFQATELIDALYELLIWCITNEYLKLSISN